MTIPDSVSIPEWAQGRSGMGQGGYSAFHFGRIIGEPAAMNFRAPIPLETTMEVGAVDTVIMDAAPRADGLDHDAPLCFSCGTHEESMKVHAGLLDDGSGRFATDWTPPAWIADEAGRVDDAAIWTALDCSQGFYVSRHPADVLPAVTVRYAVEVIGEVWAGEHYAVVAFEGRWSRGWDGRKKGAGACLFDESGELVASSESLWVADG